MKSEKKGTLKKPGSTCNEDWLSYVTKILSKGSFFNIWGNQLPNSNKIMEIVIQRGGRDSYNRCFCWNRVRGFSTFPSACGGIARFLFSIG